MVSDYCILSLGIFNDIKDFSQERNQKLKSRAAQLEKQIKVLIDDSVALLKARMSELGINASSPGDLLAKAKEIVLRHKELQAKASKLQAQVCVYDSLMFFFVT
jgi:H3 lysine-79-specific histone-lysine N-methyltransferase